jgi:hypothetical protein
MWSIGADWRAYITTSRDGFTAGRPDNGYTEARRVARHSGAIGMLAFVQFLEELSTDHVTLSSAEVRRMRDRFGNKTLRKPEERTDDVHA